MAKKSMIEREKKRIRLEKKYALKRTNLLHEYKQEENFTKKLEIHSKIQQLPRIVLKQEFVIAVGKQVVHVAFSAISVYHVMLYEKWHINVYYQE